MVGVAAQVSTEDARGDAAGDAAEEAREDAAQVASEAGWDLTVGAIAEAMGDVHPSVAIAAAQRYQAMFHAAELRALASLKRTGVSSRTIRRTATAGGTRTKKAASQADTRADAVNENPGLATEVAKGSLGSEQLDAIAHAAKKSDGEAVHDNQLLAEVRNAPADKASGITARWLERREADSGQSRYDRQRERRGVRFGLDRLSGCEKMEMIGDRESIHEVRQFLRQRADELYRADGGRDLPADHHPRTGQQRLYDAAVSLLTRTSDGSSGKGGSRVPSPRETIHVHITVDDDTGAIIEATAPGGAGLLPASVFERYACTAAWAATVFGQDGATLWHGTAKRFATDEQFNALAARDRGCVICGVDPALCVAHHLIPVNSPRKGETNIDEMALVCTDCHHQIHDNNITLYWQLGPPTPDGRPNLIWHTRPARPDEIPPPRPDQHNHRAA